jgi:hypothetical protein
MGRRTDSLSSRNRMEISEGVGPYAGARWL